MKKVADRAPQKLTDRQLKKALKEAREKIKNVKSDEESKELADHIDQLLEEADRRFIP